MLFPKKIVFLLFFFVETKIKPELESGHDCLICAKSARQRRPINLAERLLPGHDWP